MVSLWYKKIKTNSLYGWLFKGKRPRASIFPPAIVIMVATLSSKILGIGREIIFATKFGAPPQLDAYQAAFQIPDLLTKIFVLGAFSSAFIPVYARYKELGKEQDAWKLADVVTTYVMGIIILCSLLVFLLAPLLVPLIAPGFDEVRREYTVVFLRIMLLSPIFLGVSNVFSSVLNSHHNFTSSAFAPVMYNLGIITGAVVFEQYFGMVWGLALGVAFGAFLHAAIQFYPLIKIGYRFKMDFDFRFAPVREVMTLAIPRIIGLGAAQIDMFVDIILASFLPVGSIALLNYANRLQSMPVGIFGMAIATACFPTFVRKAAKKDADGFKDVLVSNIKSILYFTIPASVILIVMRVEIVRLLFGLSGKLSWFETRSVAFALALYAISISAQALVFLLSKAFYSLQDTKTPVVASLISVAINSMFSYIFIMTTPHFAMLALSYTVANLVNVLLLLAFIQGKIEKFSLDLLVKPLGVITLGAAAMGASLALLEYWLSRWLFDITKVADLMILTMICLFVGIFVYFGVTMVLGRNEFSWIRIFLGKWKQLFRPTSL